MDYTFKIKELKEQPTLTVRTRTPIENLPQEIGSSYGAIMQYLGDLGVEPVGMPFAIYYNLDMQDLDVEIGFPVPKQFKDKGMVKASKLPKGKVASCIHMGPYEEMKPTYDALTEWVQKKGYETTGIAIEYYYNDPNEVAPEEIMTEIQLPLK
ncbi:MAG: GyrI-like domain-containing protein [Promethearchaeota archaeon]